MLWESQILHCSILLWDVRKKFLSYVKIYLYFSDVLREQLIDEYKTGVGELICGHTYSKYMDSKLYVLQTSHEI
jgi:hypothetical protein